MICIYTDDTAIYVCDHKDEEIIKKLESDIAV